MQHALNTLIERIHHDLNGPLMSISGLTQVARLTDRPEEIHGYLDNIQNLAHKLSGILEQLVEVSYIHQEPPNLHELDLGDEIELVVSGFSEWPQSRTIDIDMLTMPRLVQLDPNRLRAVLSHVLSNAIIHHDPLKEQQWIRVIQETGPEADVIRVLDNGRGMPEVLTQKAFEMFVTGESAEKGSGLGLYLAREAARSMGGDIWLHSEPGKGTQVTIQFPLAKHLTAQTDQVVKSTVQH